MPKQNTSPTPEEELPPAAIAFMKKGTRQTKSTPETPNVPLESRDAGNAMVCREKAQSSTRKRRRTKPSRKYSALDSTSSAIEPPRRPFSTRIRTDLYVQLKEISLTRELQRTPPFHMSEIVEQAIEAWLLDVV